MKMMKKFGLLVALALIVTVGGVYATWTYASGDRVGDLSTKLTLDLADYEIIGGNLSVADGTGISVIVDDPLPNDHKAELVINGTMIILFTPAGNTTDKSIGDMTFTITIAAEPTDPSLGWKYDDKDIFTIKDGGKILNQKLTKIESTTVVGGHNLGQYAGQFYLALSADDVKSLVSLPDPTFELHSINEWTDCETALHGGKLSVSVQANS